MSEKVSGTIRERVRSSARVLLAAGAIATAGLLSGCGSVKEKWDSLASARAKATEKYDQVFARSDAAGKFKLQYLSQTTLFQLKNNHDQYGYEDNVRWVFNFDNACLNNTAYATDGGHINIIASVSGLFVNASVSARGNIPATAIVSEDLNNPNLISVIPGGSHIPTLEFSGANGTGPLEPANNVTRQITAANGCLTGLVSTSIHDPENG